MSRSTVAKSRTDKTGKTTAAPTPAITHEIVPGKFTDQDWNLLVDQDDGCDLAVDLVEEICSGALDTIHQQYLERQLIPFTVMQAKDALLQVIQWQFLARDEGEDTPTTKAGWLEDEEPAPAVTDCWAQGSVPRQLATPRTARSVAEDTRLTPVPEDSIAPTLEQDVLRESAASGPGEEANDTETKEEEPANAEESSLPAEETSVQEEAKSETPPKEQKAEQKKKFKPYKGTLSSEHLTKLTESLDDTEMKMQLAEYAPTLETGGPDLALMQMPSSCHSILKLQQGRPPGNREIVLDNTGNVVAVTKINPARLPTHKVKTIFEVVDPEVEAAQARLEAMRTGRYNLTKRNKTKAKTGGTSIQPETYQSDVRTQTFSQHTAGMHKDAITPLPPPLIEAMEVSPGVVIREGDRVKHGPRQLPRRAELVLAASQKGLRPITVQGVLPKVTVQELLDHQAPTIRPLSQTPPIPPIVPHPPSQAIGSR